MSCIPEFKAEMLRIAEIGVALSRTANTRQELERRITLVVDPSTSLLQP